MEQNIPALPKNASRVVLNLSYPESRMDNILLREMRLLEDNVKLKNITRGALKKLFQDGKVQIKGQRAKTSSALAKGVTYVDLLINT